MKSRVKLPVFTHNALLLFSFYFFLFTLPFSINFSNYAFALFACLAVFRKDFISDLSKNIKHPVLLCFLIYFALLLFGILYSFNLKHGFFLIEKDLSLILIPLMLFPLKSHFSESQLRKGLTFFATGVVAAGVWLIVNLVVFRLKMPSFPIDTYFREQERIKIVQLHPTYLALYFITAIFIIYFNFPNTKKWNILLKGFLILFLFILTLCTGARAPLVGFLLVSLLFFILKTKSIRSRLITAASGLLIVPVLFYALIQIPVVKERVAEIKYTKLSPPKGVHFNSVNLRIAQLICSKDIITENWFLGVGTGDTQDALNNCYQSKGWSPALYERSYNAHNQYLQIWLTLGIPGLIVFLLLFFFAIHKTYQCKNYLFLSFVLLFAFCSLTESFLEKNKGVVFFTMLLSLFSILNTEESKAMQRKKQ